MKRRLERLARVRKIQRDRAVSRQTRARVEHERATMQTEAARDTVRSLAGTTVQAGDLETSAAGVLRASRDQDDAEQHAALASQRASVASAALYRAEKLVEREIERLRAERELRTRKENDEQSSHWRPR